MIQMDLAAKNHALFSSNNFLMTARYRIIPNFFEANVGVKPACRQPGPCAKEVSSVL